MLENLKKYNIILASGSPRRKELLSGLEINFSIRLIEGINENYPQSLKDEEIPLYISRKKAEAYIPTMNENDLIITADTVVWHNGNIIGKPTNLDHAFQIIKELSDSVHSVITGVTLLSKTKTKSFYVVTDVVFDNLEDDEILYYVNKYKPLDKAGAYGIQELIGYIGVKSINGSYYNVMGLPVQRLYKELKEF